MSAGFTDKTWTNAASVAVTGTASSSPSVSTVGSATATSAPAGDSSSLTGVIVKDIGPRRPTRRPTRARWSLPTIRLNGIRLHQVTERQAIDYVLDELDAGHGGVVVTPNLDHVRRCEADVNFGALVAEAQLVVADGMPLVWASRLRGTPLPERVAGSSLVSTLTEAAGKRGRSVFLLGGSPGTADGAARILRERYPHAKVVGTFYPPEGFEYDARLIAQMEAALSAADPDIVYVALGSPKQERLICRLKQLLPNTWWMGVGVSFSFLTGDVKRAPHWMQKSGVEWVHRLAQEPRRLFKRYVVVGIPYAGMLFARSALDGVRTRLTRWRNARATPVTTTNGAPATAVDAALATLSTPVLERKEIDDLSDVVARRVRRAAAAIEPPDPIVFTPTTYVDATSTRATPLAKLRGFVLLGGGVRPTPLGGAVGRSVLDLPIDASSTILSHWLDQTEALAELASIEKLPVRILVDRNSPAPGAMLGQRYADAFRVERDLSDYRGTGGVLRDLADSYADDDYVLVANASQVLLDPLPVIATALDRKRADVALVSHRDGTPSGLMLVRCGTLRRIPATGFVDMKEQALPAIAVAFDVRVVHARRSTGIPVWTLQDYVGALRQYHGAKTGRRTTDPLAEDWRPMFSIVEDNATVDPTARVHDSVVLAGGRVEPGALVVRSVVCDGSVVKRDSVVVDEQCGTGRAKD
jgi:N-acetylglucosaminyldiphosphoundecaprenol N-acetyl-beta-D-mannosaminyltransferase